VIALETNLLVHARRRDSLWHDAAYARLTGLPEGRAVWASPWLSLHECMAIVTRPRMYAATTPP
jgi:uncharacterized protein